MDLGASAPTPPNPIVLSSQRSVGSVPLSCIPFFISTMLMINKLYNHIDLQGVEQIPRFAGMTRRLGLGRKGLKPNVVDLREKASVNT